MLLDPIHSTRGTCSFGDHISSVDPSVPSILQPWVRILSKTSTLFQIILYLLLDWIKNEKEENKQGVARLKKPYVGLLRCFEIPSVSSVGAFG